MLTIKVFIVCHKCERTQEIAVSNAPLPDTGYIDARIETPLPDRWQRTSYGPVCDWCLAEAADLPCRVEQDRTYLEQRLRAYASS